jgi:hypothetical protein
MAVALATADVRSPMTMIQMASVRTPVNSTSRAQFP